MVISHGRNKTNAIYLIADEQKYKAPWFFVLFCFAFGFLVFLGRMGLPWLTGHLDCRSIQATLTKTQCLFHTNNCDCMHFPFTKQIQNGTLRLIHFHPYLQFILASCQDILESHFCHQLV